ncbi:hypothetical protein CFIMG_000611RA [Ceratocystis fimbriata CBS 114723]|uniref:Uncharacterized protein n=1 Tax=Ceratocystis fimbriata CBS 114723 TaxID=1035309 RepID=A0A2C5XBB4_9PEZI|nr:hypothetical protein CFIMG_000611RA [Ceratocystis fimbriata CBS 114723]
MGHQMAQTPSEVAQLLRCFAVSESTMPSCKRKARPSSALLWLASSGEVAEVQSVWRVACGVDLDVLFSHIEYSPPKTAHASYPTSTHIKGNDKDQDKDNADHKKMPTGPRFASKPAAFSSSPPAV